MTVNEQRRHELADGLAAVRARIAAAADAAGRSADEITLVVVTKTWPADDVVALGGLGATDVGENKHQEAEAKHAEVVQEAPSLRWHFIGQIQSNKATHIAAYADTVHSVATAKVARRLEKGAADHGRRIGCFVQVNLDDGDGADGRGGVAPDDVLSVASVIADADHLDLLGVMGVAPLGRPAAPAYATLAACRDEVAQTYPAATAMSAGMSGDYEEAIAAGATHVRVGSAVLGQRPPLG